MSFDAKRLVGGVEVGELLRVARRAALAGGAAIRRHLQDFELSYKSDKTPVTTADLAANEAILRELAATPFGVCSEEGVLDASRRAKGEFWLVDPLDGTSGFVRRNGEFCVCVAFIDAQGRAAVGAIYSPILQRLWLGASCGFGLQEVVCEAANEALKHTRTNEPKNLLKSNLVLTSLQPHTANSPSPNSRVFQEILEQTSRKRAGVGFAKLLCRVRNESFFEVEEFADFSQTFTNCEEKGEFAKIKFGFNNPKTVVQTLAEQGDTARLRECFASPPQVLCGRNGEAQEFCRCFNLDAKPLGSALKFTLLATNQSGILLKTYPSSHWDIAAAEALLTACGGGVFAFARSGVAQLDYTAASFTNPNFIALSHAKISDLADFAAFFLGTEFA